MVRDAQRREEAVIGGTGLQVEADANHQVGLHVGAGEVLRVEVVDNVHLSGAVLSIELVLRHSMEVELERSVPGLLAATGGRCLVLVEHGADLARLSLVVPKISSARVNGQVIPDGSPILYLNIAPISGPC